MNKPGFVEKLSTRWMVDTSRLVIAVLFRHVVWQFCMTVFGMAEILKHDDDHRKKRKKKTKAIPELVDWCVQCPDASCIREDFHTFNDILILTAYPISIRLIKRSVSSSIDELDSHTTFTTGWDKDLSTIKCKRGLVACIQEVDKCKASREFYFILVETEARER